MKSQADPFNEFLTTLPDLVERRILLRQELKELDFQIRQAVRKEHELGTHTQSIAECVGVSSSRIRELVNFG